MKKRLNAFIAECLAFMVVMFMASVATAQCPNSGPLTCSDPNSTSQVLFFEDWENFNAQGWTGNIDPTPAGFPTAGNWALGRTGGTPSGGTGPLSADCGNRYAYWETSGGAPPVNLNFPNPICLVTATDAEISFYWHAAGVANQTVVNLQASIDGGATWNTEFTIVSGDTPTQGSPFTLASVDLSAYVGNELLLRFNGSQDTRFEDIAIDNIQVQACASSTACSDPPAPVITSCPSVTNPVSTDANTCSAFIDLPPLQFTDGCPGAIVTNDLTGTDNADGEYFPGETIITWTVLDTDCNRTTCQTTIEVVDLTPPVVNCPGDITLNLAPGECSTFYSYNVDFSDNCPFQGPEGTLLSNPGNSNNGNAAGGLVLFDLVNNTSFPMTITGMSSSIDGPSDIDVYTKSGTGFGFETNAAAWTLVATGDASAGPFGGGTTTAPFAVNFTIPPGITGVALHMVSTTSNYNGIGAQGVPYGTGPNSVFDDGNLTILCGATTNGFFAPGLFNTRRWIGSVTYETISGGDLVQTMGLPSGSEFPIGTTTNCFEVEDANGNPGSCCFDVTVAEFPNPTQGLTCNDGVQVSLDSFCLAVIGADDILEGGPYGCYDTRYTVMVLSPLGQNLGNTVDQSFIGKTWTVKVVDNETDQSCWGSVVVEDKLPPVIECLNYSVACTEDLNHPDFLKPSPGIFEAPDPLFTESAGAPGNFFNGFAGVTFDLVNSGTAPLIVNGFRVPFSVTDHHVDVYFTTTATTNVGVAQNAAEWTLLGSVDITGGAMAVAWDVNTFQQVDVGGLTLAPGESKGLYIVTDGAGAALRYTNGAFTATDGNLTIESNGAAGGPNFANTFTPRAFVGEVQYSIELDEVPPFDNCSSVSLEHFDDFVDGSCGGPSGVITRTWTGTDNSGNETTCVSIITLERPDLSEVEIPNNIKWTCTQYEIFPNITDPTPVHEYITDCDDTSDLLDATCYDASCDDLDIPNRDRANINSTVNGNGCPGRGLDDADVLALTGSGYPSVGGNALVSICEIGVEYEDVIIQECVGSFKIVRQWTLVDWCANPVVSRHEEQIIKVVDEEAPVVELFGVAGETESNYGNTQIPALGNLGNPATTGGCGQAPQNTGGTVFTALVQLPGTGSQFNPDMFTNISLESVELTLNHQHVEDLDIFLKGPSNKVIELSTDNGVDGTGYHRTKFSDSATVPIAAANSPFTGTYLPEGTFDISCGGFNGTVQTLADMTTNWQADVLGTWELIIFDDDEDNIGEMVSWSLSFSFGDVTLDVYNATATSNIHTVCEGSVLVPPVANCTDNCSGIASYTTELWTMDDQGDPEFQIGIINGNGGYFDNIPMYRNGLPARYIVRYSAVDGCKNQASVDMTVRLRDRVPPVVVCDEITEIVITNNGQNTGSSCSRLYAEDLDDGSYDNCTPIYFLMAKMDDSFSQDIYNRCYYPHRDFCCDDVGDNTVIVLVLDQDPSLFYNTNIGSPALGCNEPTPNFPSLFLSPNSIGNFVVPGTNQLVPVNYNTCMVTVQVTDKLPPVLVNCPGNERISCDLYASNLETQLANAADMEEQCDILSAYFGTAEYFDNCIANVECEVDIDLDQCLEGEIERVWSATDNDGNTNSSQDCRQRIFVDQVSDFVVEFPQNRDDDILGGHLPAVECGDSIPDFGEPEIFYETCELVAVSYEDEVFTDVDSACYKILREWTVINWCVVGDEIDQEVEEDSELAMRLAGCLSSFQGECDLDGDGDCDDRTFRDSWAICDLPDAPHATDSFGPDTDPDSDPWDGFIQYQQVIKVKDSVDPVFTNGCNIPDVCITDNTCSATVLLPTPDITDCSTDITFSYEILMGGVWSNGAGPYFPVAPGEYPVRYRAVDNCNNQTACETVLTVADCKKPTPYCKNGIIVELMVVDPAMVEVWASDLNDNSFDNCPGALKYSFSADVGETSIVFDCDDIGQNTVEMWVTDAAGNQDFCETAVIIQANMNQCDDSLSVAGGQLATEFGAGVPDVSVNINSPGGFSADAVTDGNGVYAAGVPPGGDYTVTPVHDVDPLNGVTTYDLVVISKHILGVDLLDSPYQVIAADANRSNTVTTFDLVELRKLILFINTDFPNNTSWRFVDKGFAFSDPSNPFATAFPEVVNLNNLTASQLTNDFVAVKVGDVNGSASVNLSGAGTGDRNTVGSLVLGTDDVRLEAGASHTVEFSAKDFAVSGFQFTLAFDTDALAFDGIEAGLADESNFGFTMVEEGIITASWNSNDVESLTDGEMVFGLTFTAKQGGNLSGLLSINSRYTVAEAYTIGNGLMDVALNFGNTAVIDGFELYQNTPNPFAATTTVGFHLPEATSATLTISDVQGKVVKVIEGDYAKGYNQEVLKRSELGATGVLYYRLDTDTDSATRMMILVD